ncbi:GNAT family N-acetyltransferase [Idiomarina loihiensis]|uniref:GNAT family N-acetyltransferase n=1 Tax=Idiomarina loihiensis TaxID=135577 RepID=UPI00384C0D28
MRSYYEQYSVEWDSVEIEKMTRELMNFDILFEGEPVGIIRLSFDDEGCHLRDLQVDERYQNRGIGSRALAETERLAREADARMIRLKVFKNSPAVNLYKKTGFSVSQEDDRFYYMTRFIF